MKELINVFGGSGFIGSRFCELYKDQVLKNERADYTPKSNNILYFISTVDNYNVHKNLSIDIDTNLKVLVQVLEKIPKNTDVVFNFISSWFVYGKNNEIPFNEDSSKCKPTGFYSITKYCAEQLLISFCETFDIKYRIFRLSNVLGEGDKKASKQKNALQFLISEIVKGNDVELYYGGAVMRDYIYVDDVCDALYTCMEKAPLDTVINIGSGTPYIFKDLIQRAIDISHSKSKIINIEPTKFHNIVQVRHSYLDTTKLSKTGFRCKNSMDIILERLVNFYQKQNTK